MDSVYLLEILNALHVIPHVRIDKPETTASLALTRELTSLRCNIMKVFQLLDARLLDAE